MNPGDGFCIKIKKIDKPLTRVIKKKEDPNKYDLKWGGKTDTKGTQRIVRKYCEQVCANKLDNLDEMDKFLESYNPAKLNQEESENPNKQIINEIEIII